MPDTPTNPAPCPRTYTKLQRTSALEGGYCHRMGQMLVLSMLMHIRCTYVAYVCLYPYVCLYLRMFAISLCTSIHAYGLL
jgi:hypothetical protein